MTVASLVILTTVTDQVRYQHLNMQKAKGLRCVALRYVLRQSEGIRLTAPDKGICLTTILCKEMGKWFVSNVYIAITILTVCSLSILLV